MTHENEQRLIKEALDGLAEIDHQMSLTDWLVGWGEEQQTCLREAVGRLLILKGFFSECEERKPEQQTAA